MHLFANAAFLRAMGWALLNSLWQFALCWIIYQALVAQLRTVSAAVKHNLALLLLLAGSVSFIATLFINYAAASAIAAPALIEIVSTPYFNLWQSARQVADALMPYWSVIYLVSVLFLLLKFCLFVQRATHLQQQAASKMNAAWRTHIAQIAAQLGIRRPVKALLSLHIDTPQVIGFFKPVILVPAACLTSLSTEQLEAVLLHELVHIKRNDYLVNLFVTSIDILFFFNPFVKHITAALRKEREYSCDDMVIQFQYQPHHYASALLTLEKSRLLPVTYGIAAGGKNQQQLLTRIERIMGMQHKQSGRWSVGLCLLMLVLMGLIASINPSKLAIDKFGTDALLLAHVALPGTETPVPINSFNAKDSVLPAKPAVKETNTARKASIAPATSNNESLATELAYTASFAEDEDNDVLIGIQSAAHKETINFSMPAKEPAAVPATAIPSAGVEEPYVPAGSFSYHLVQDTAMPKLKGETYNERVAKDAMLKVQKALEEINWQKIEKQLKYDKRALAKLKTAIGQQLQELNWQKINNDVANQRRLEQLQQLQEAVKQEQIIKQYQLNEAYNEALHRQMAEQEQLLREGQQRAQESRKAAAEQDKKLQQVLKKKRIIYI
ncbi:MAG TPA: M56 family metallopeptidase [Chitinophagaceae bacterium]|nr:M56 family metallopeptidase [Chitinophagaceae bacterium]